MVSSENDEERHNNHKHHNCKNYKLSEKRIFPAIDLQKSSTRREDLLLSDMEQEAINIMRKALNGVKSDEATDRILEEFSKSRNNTELVKEVIKRKFI